MKGCGSYMAMVVIQIAYGGSNVLIKLALEKGLNQFVFVVYRHMIAMLLLGPFAYTLERKQWPPLSYSSLAKIFVLASIGTTIHLNLYYAGLRYTSPTVASALSNVIPSVTLTIALLIGLENVNLGSAKGKAKVMGTLVCTGGSLIFIFWKGESLFKGSERKPLIQISGNHTQHESWVKGSLLILISYVAWSVWLILQAVVSKTYPAPLSLNVLICFFASLQSSILALFWGARPDMWKLCWDLQLLTIVYCGIVISALAYYLQTWCISKKGPVFVSMYSPLLLVVVGLYSAIVSAEKLHVGSLVGALLIIMGLYCVLWGKRADGSIEEEQTNSKGVDHEDKIIDVLVEDRKTTQVKEVEVGGV